MSSFLFKDGVARPMTAVHAAGFTKAAVRGMACRNRQLQREMLVYNFQYSLCFAGSSFDPLGQARGPAPPLEMKNSDRFVQCCIKLFQSINSNKKLTTGRV